LRAAVPITQGIRAVDHPSGNFGRAVGVAGNFGVWSGRAGFPVAIDIASGRAIFVTNSGKKEAAAPMFPGPDEQT
jgi:hypothetical protein